MLWELALLLFLICCFFDWMKRRRDQQQMPNIPIVSRIPFVGSLLKLGRFQPDNTHLKFKEYVTKYGKTFSTRLLGQLFVVTADTRYVDVLLSSQSHIRKHQLYLLLHTWLGDGLLLSHSRKWQMMRKIITPAFHFKILEQFVNVFDNQSRIMVEKLSEFADGETCVNIYPHMGLMMLDVIAETAMGVCINAQIDSKSDFAQAVKDVTEIVTTRFIRPLLAIPICMRIFAPQLYKRQQEGIAAMHQFTNRIIEERKNTLQRNVQLQAKLDDSDADVGIKRRMALLDVLLQSTTPDGQPISDTQIRDEVNTFMFEGHDTTTSAASFCLYLLSRHADCQHKLFEELRSYFGDDLTRPIEYRDLHDLTYLNCVIKEALRLYPPIPAIGRWLKEDLVLPDVTIPAGTNIIVLLWEILRDPDVFDEPERFWPERHLKHNNHASVFTNIPFSAGPRNCIGQKFALYELRTVVVQMLRHFELLPLGAEVHPSIKIVLRSKTGVNMAIKRRIY